MTTPFILQVTIVILGIMRNYEDDADAGEYHIGVQTYKCLGNAYKITLIGIQNSRLIIRGEEFLQFRLGYQQSPSKTSQKSLAVFQ
jgi:hypothetical protein